MYSQPISIEMNEDTFLQSLSKQCPDSELLFQVILDKPYIYVYINRTSDRQPDYASLTEKIRIAIAELQIPQLAGVWLYSRAMGAVDPDWETSIAFSTESEAISEPVVTDSPAEEINEPVVTDSFSSSEETNEDCIEEEFNLSQYCFTRNKSLLAAELVPPAPKIARLLQFFHGLTDPPNKRF